MKKIVITGGHFTPAIALIEELEKEKNFEIIFFGRKYATQGSSNLSAEYKEITGRQIKFVPITAGKLARRPNRYLHLSLAKLPIGFIQSFYYLLKYRPHAVVSFGGYLSFPVIFSAWLLGISSVTHEQASKPGLANRLNSLFVNTVFLTWPQTSKYFDNAAQVIGNPTRKAIFQKTSKDKKIAAFLKNAKNLLFVTGGNQGSHFINNLIFENLNALGSFQVLHQIGTANYKNDHQKAAKIKKANYLSVDFIPTQDIGAVFEKAQVIISRSGANTVWDIASLAKNAIFIPLPFSAGNEQYQNARILEEAGSCVALKQSEANSKKFEDTLKQFEASLPQKKAAAVAFKKTLPQNASSKIKKFLENI